MTSTPRELSSLIRTARQLLQTERSLAGDVLPAERPALPTIQELAAAAPAAQEQPGMGPMTTTDKAAALEEIAQEVRACCRCGLGASRTQAVPGEGNPDARVMFIGEGPGAEEDAQGRPFVGKAGQLLDKQIEAMGLKRRDVYIANVVKCRPPGNRTPTPEESAACWPYLKRQIEIIRPEVIVTLGNPATQALLNTIIGITRLRGHWQEFAGIPVMPTFHPAYLLRQYSVDNRRRVWDDLQKVMERLGLPKPAKGGLNNG